MKPARLPTPKRRRRGLLGPIPDPWRDWADMLSEQLKWDRIIILSASTTIAHVLQAQTYAGLRARERTEAAADEKALLDQWSATIGIPLRARERVSTVAARFARSPQGRMLRGNVAKRRRERRQHERRDEQAARHHMRRETRLLRALQTHRRELQRLFDDAQRDEEDIVYRYYHRSFKAYDAQSVVGAAVSLFKRLLPGESLNENFLKIVGAGTPGKWKPEHNERWAEIVRPQLEAFFHVRYFLAMALKYSELRRQPRFMPCGWASLLYLWNMR
jgi:hypothetical protein